MRNGELGQNMIVEIQALRAIAVLLVVFYHGGMSWFSGGYIGVDVFFVISGYLITGLIMREHKNTGRINLSSFYARRIRRLFPASAATVIVVCIVAWLFYSPLEFKMLTSSAIAATVYLSNLWFFEMATDYLAIEPHTNPLLHTWSLSVEEQFYLFWPLLIIGLTRFSRSADVPLRVLYGLSALSILSLILCVIHTYSNQPLAFFGTHARAWEFGVGGIVALAHARGVTPSQDTRMVLLLLGLFLIFGPAFTYDERTVFPGFSALWPVLGTALVIHSSAGNGLSGYNSWMKCRPIQFLGDISYSLYLWHWPVAIVLQGYVDILDWLWLPAYMGISLLLASISYTFVENPVRYSGVLTSKTANSYYLGVAASVLVLCIVGVGRIATERELARSSQVAYRNAATDMAVIYKDGCHLDQLATSIPEGCVYGPTGASRSLVLFGDSHAANWFPALNSLAFDQGFKLYSLTKSACPSVFFEPHNRMLNRQYTECTQWRNNALQFIIDTRPSLIVFSNSDRYFLSRPDKQESHVEVERLRTAIGETRDWLDKAGIRYVFIRDTPWLEFDPLNCLSRAAWKGHDSATTCTFRGVERKNREIHDLYVASLAESKVGLVVDLNKEICPKGQDCVLQRENLILYRDSNHLTASFSEYLSSILLENLRASGVM